MRFSRQEYRSGLPHSLPGDLLHPGIKFRSLTLQVDSLMLSHWGSPDKPRQYIKKQSHHFPTKVHIVKAMVFSVVMYGCESWTIKKPKHWRTDFWIVMLENTLGSTMDGKEIKPVNPKGNQPWIFTGRTDAETEVPIGHLMWRAD